MGAHVKRLGLVSLALFGMFVVAACSGPAADTVSEAQAGDPLLAAASEASTATPVEIVGYDLTFRLDRALPDGGSQQDIARRVVMKSGDLLQLPQEGPLTNAGMTDDLEQPTERLSPEPESERSARLAAIDIARAEIAGEGDGKFADVEPFVRSYVIEDANGDRFYIKPDGTDYAPAPQLVPYE